MEEDWLANPVNVDPSLEENQISLDDTMNLLGSEKIRDTLRTCGFNSLFPVQRAVLQTLQDSTGSHDLLVSASTGSGKTLAYTLPIIKGLSSRLVVRLRALIVVPGRELAQQVASVVEPFALAAGLNVAAVYGQTSMVAEQKKLVTSLDNLLGGSSNIDILIATPGRLVDHLQSTAGFTLQHLEWLVLDEADRLLDQNFQDWLPRVLQACKSESLVLPTESSQHDAIGLRENQAPKDSLYALNCWATPLRKMLFSATLTKNPAKLAQLHLCQPIYLSVSTDSTKYTVPDDLEEFMIVAEDGEKVLSLLHLLESDGVTRALCFTKSVEATEKLSILLKSCLTAKADRIAAFSSDLFAGKRTEILESFNNGQIDLLICSDGAARGLDLQAVAAVISYDVPVHCKTYIHRVGRTARAGQSGKAYAILESREAHHFKQMLAQGRSGKRAVIKMKLKQSELESFRPLLDSAMAQIHESNDRLTSTILGHFNRN